MSAVTSEAAAKALSVLRQVGIPIMLESRVLASLRSLRRREVAQLLGLSVTWVREHEAEFPNRWRAGEDIRIPLADVESYVARQKVQP